MTEESLPPGGPGQSATGSYIAQAGPDGTAIVAVFQAAPPRPIDPTEIAAAEALLAELPIDSLPDPSGLPPGSSMRWRRNHFFVGREPDLRELARQLKQGGTAAVGQSPAVTGLGGQGKTQLAVEFAYRFGRWFRGGVFWVDCSNPAAIPEGIAACATALATDAGFSARPLPERVALVASSWASPLPRLLIFDNCEDESLLDDWAPKGGGCRLLLTARRLSWSPARGITTVSLGRLTRPESLELLHRHRPDLPPDDPGLSGIAEELGDLPLALELAGSYLARYRHDPIGDPAAYLTELRDADVLAHASMIIEDPEAPGQSRTLTGHEQDVARTFDVSLRGLQPADPVDTLARRIFACAAWLAPGLPIPRHLLKLCIGIAPEDTDGARRFTLALERLLNLALLERADKEGGAVILHRLVAAFARARLEQAEAVRLALEEAMAKEAERLLPLGDPTPLRDWAGHLLAVALAARSDYSEVAIRLLNAAGIYSSVVADFQASVAILQDTIERAQAFLGPDHPQVTFALTNLGSVHRQCGNLAAAEADLTRALAIKERAFGPDDPEVAKTLTNLGNVQRERDNLDAAEANITRALAIEEKAFGPDDPQVARTLTNLGGLQQERGNLAAAEAYLTRALAIKEKAHGSNHAQLIFVLGNLGILHRKGGNFAAAETYLTRVLEIVEKAHDPDHPQMAKTLTHLGIVQHKGGNLAAAEAKLTRALAIGEKAFGSDHHEVGFTLISLGDVQWSLGRISDARESYTRAATILVAQLGEQHSNTITVQQRLDKLNRDVEDGRDDNG